MKRIKQYMRRPSFLSAGVVAALMVVVGCGDFNESSMGSFEEVGFQEVKEAPAGYVVFSEPMARMVASKTVKVASTAFSHRVKKGFKIGKNEQMEIEFNTKSTKSAKGSKGSKGAKNAIRVKTAKFSVVKNSIDLSGLTKEQVSKYVHRNEVDITMVISSGTKLNEVVVAFGPEGLIFNPMAKLDIQLTGKLKGMISNGKSFAYHIDGEGKISKVRMEAKVETNSSKLRIEVPGFSRYSWDD